MHSWRIHIMWEVGLTRVIQDPSSFTLCLSGVSWSQVSTRAVLLCSPLGLSISAFNRGASSHLRSLQPARPEYPVLLLVREFTFGGLSPHPIQRDRSKGWGVLVHSSFSWLSLSSVNLLYRDDFVQSTHGVGMAWVSTGGFLWTSP